MNTMHAHPNTVPQSPLPPQAMVRPAITEAQTLYWCIRREIWENRSIYIAPLAVAAITLFGFLIATIGRALAVPDLAQRRAVLEEPYTFAALLIMGTTFVVAVFYCLDALHGERRDRSILFWKSLPVSDFNVVLSKACIPLVVLPLLTFAITLATQWIMLLLSSAVMLASGLSPATLWTRLSLLDLSLLLYHLLAGHGLYYAPIYAWLLLVSAWARRATFVWAALPLVAIGVFEKIAFHTSYFAAMLGNRIAGRNQDVPFSMQGTAGSMPMSHQSTLLALSRFLVSPGMLVGLLIAGVFLLLAVRLRRSQGPV